MVLTILQGLLLGIIQGITEWLPISSSGAIVLVMTNLFGITNVELLLKEALLLHLGTVLAAVVYFRKDVKELTIELFKYRSSEGEKKKILNFLILSTIITGIIGILILKFIGNSQLELTGRGITLSVAALLLITAGMQVGSRKAGGKNSGDLKNSDSVLLGATQGIAGLPGISRSGITVSTLLLRNFDDTTALRLSFLMSIPVVLLANIALNINELSFTMANILGVLVAFVIGLATIHGLIKISKKINFAYFLVIFALLMILSVFV